MIHVGESGRIHGSGASLVDFNRGGTPLVEIVTEPDLRSAAEAAAWARLLRETVRQLERLRRQHGGGQPAGRRQRLGAPGGQRGARHQDRAEEHEQLPLPRTRGRGRAGPPARADRGGGDGRAGDAALRPRQRHAHLAALEGGGARLPLLPRARPGAAGADRGDAARGARVAAGAAGGAGRALPRGAGPRPRTSPRCWPPTRRRPPTSSGPRRRPAGSSRGSSPTGSPASWPRRCARRGSEGAAESKVEPEALAALVGMVAEKKISHGSGKTVLAALVAEGGDPAAIVEREGLAQIVATAASSSRSSPPRSRPTPRPPSRSAPATARRSARSSASS